MALHRPMVIWAPLHHCSDFACRHAGPYLGPRKKAEPEPEDAQEEEFDDSPFSSRIRTVDGMTTKLDRASELMPAAGPDVIDEPQEEVDIRPLFASVGLYAKGLMPSDDLQDAYYEWLSESDNVCLPHYLLSAQDFVEEMNTVGDVLTDDEIAQLDAQEEVAAAAAAAAQEMAKEAADSEDAARAAEAAGQPATGDLAMVSMGVGFVLGHLTVVRADSWSSAEAWVATDPVRLAGGYEAGHLHQWLVSADETLNNPSVGEVQQCFAVHCVDRHDSTDLRTSTRDAHLRFLQESGRVVKGGPLLAVPEAEEFDATGGEKSLVGVGPRVGTLLIVNGDGLAEVRDWADEDPYNKAGLFESVTVAPLASYAIDTLPL
eukprot:CAMPEP_0174698146 /NCGR_PEP_ID=MMETSP1094-20130205/3803_1 /TAXON_ID=156173 /ORGANISM="Chrysochromulina brevifilum, Strain UTEX LB 985" /LENGTH=373 /DNA_ID=CAMNT_0015895257 /DNA_START=107 /DNA_END=1228 /DNA_ORIENTATION=+